MSREREEGRNASPSQDPGWAEEGARIQGIGEGWGTPRSSVSVSPSPEKDAQTHNTARDRTRTLRVLGYVRGVSMSCHVMSGQVRSGQVLRCDVL